MGRSLIIVVETHTNGFLESVFGRTVERKRLSGYFQFVCPSLDFLSHSFLLPLFIPLSLSLSSLSLFITLFWTLWNSLEDVSNVGTAWSEEASERVGVQAANEVDTPR